MHFVYPSKCPGCASVILLHEPILERITRHLGSWSRDGWNINLLCATCGRAYTHDHGEIPSYQTESEDPYLLPSGPTVFHAALECDNESCESPVVVIALRDSGATEESVTAELPKWNTADLRCSEGYLAVVPLRFQKLFFVPIG